MGSGRRLVRWWFLAGAVALFFSYYPLMSFGTQAAMHMEMSVAEIWLVGMAVIALPTIWRARRELMRSEDVRAVVSVQMNK